MPRNPRIVLYALSTCVWCKRTKRLLDQLGVKYQVIDVDLLPPGKAAEVEENMRSLDTDGNFPVLVVNGKTVVSGYNEERIMEAVQ